MINEIVWIYALQWMIALWLFLRKKKTDVRVSPVHICILILMPVAGLVFFTIVWVYQLTPRETPDDIFDHNLDVTENVLRYEKKIEFSKEVNYVPVEEALILNNSAVKRKLIMDTVKEDAYDYISFLKMAMADHDMETSHYAASIILETNRNLQNVIQATAVAYENDKDNMEALEAYTEVVGKYYKSGLIDSASEVRYGNIYSQLLQTHLSLKKHSEYIFTEKIETDIKLGNYHEVSSDIEYFRKNYPESEKPYLLLLKLYYQQKNYEGIQDLLSEMEDYHVNFSRKGQEIIKFWSEREA